MQHCLFDSASVISNALSIRDSGREVGEIPSSWLNRRVASPSARILWAQRRLRNMLALRRIGEATLLRDNDKVPELMNLHRGYSAGSNVLSKALPEPGF